MGFFGGNGGERRMIRLLIISVFHSCDDLIPCPRATLAAMLSPHHQMSKASRWCLWLGVRHSEVLAAPNGTNNW